MAEFENPIWSVDYKTIPRATIDEMLRQSELRQAAIFQASMGLDQRAAVLAAGLIAAAGALAAAALTLSGSPVRPLRLAIFVAVLLSGVAAGCCIWACRPQGSRFPGIEPLDWAANPAYLHTPIAGLLTARVAQLQDHIAQNAANQKKNGNIMKAGILIAAFTPLATLATWVFFVAFA